MPKEISYTMLNFNADSEKIMGMTIDINIEKLFVFQVYAFYFICSDAELDNFYETLQSRLNNLSGRCKDILLINSNTKVEKNTNLLWPDVVGKCWLGRNNERREKYFYSFAPLIISQL